LCDDIDTVVPEDCKEEILEAAAIYDSSSFIDGHTDKHNENARKQMRTVQPGAQTAKWKEYKEKYGLQPKQVIEGFTQSEGVSGILDTNASKRSTRGKQAAESSVEIPPPPIVRSVPGMFHGMAGIAANWKLGFTSLINGTGFQHPHAYNRLKIFPFVALHGFGLDSFSLWLFPEPFR
jgi:hypothetical protein